MRFILIFLFSICVFSVSSQTVGNPAFKLLLNTLLDHSVKEVSIEELGDNYSKYIVLDARAFEEYQVSHLENAKFVGYDNFCIDSVNYAKDKPIIVYCSIGYRSEKIAEKLLNAGYSNVYNLYGGIFEWKNKEKDVVDSLGITEYVHAYDKKMGTLVKKRN